MLKAMVRIAIMPVLLIGRLLLGTLAFITTISSAVIGLGTGLFIILAMVEFFIGYWQNGIALLALGVLGAYLYIANRGGFEDIADQLRDLFRRRK